MESNFFAVQSRSSSNNCSRIRGQFFLSSREFLLEYVSACRECNVPCMLSLRAFKRTSVSRSNWYGFPVQHLDCPRWRVLREHTWIHASNTHAPTSSVRELYLLTNAQTCTYTYVRKYIHIYMCTFRRRREKVTRSCVCVKHGKRWGTLIACLWIRFQPFSK